MTLQTASIQLAGLTLEGAFDGKDYFVCVPELEKALGWRAESTREKLASKSLKAFTDKTLAPGKKKRKTGGFVGVLSVKDFSVLVGWQAQEGNKAAVSLLIALAAEAIERRIDSALNITKTEEEYEQQTKAFFRELSRKAFIPELTSWWQDDSRGFAVNYGAEVNKFKANLGLPQKSVNEFNMSEMQTWAKAITGYNMLRMEGYSHQRATKRVRQNLAFSVES